MVDYFFVIIAFIVWAVIEGEREGLYYHEASKTKNTILQNSHPLFFVQRVIVFLFIAIGCSYILLPLSLVFMFSFIHDGSYYNMRNRLNPNVYPKKFFDNSTTSNAFFEFNFKWRLFLFIVGVLLYLTTLIFLV